MDTKHLIVGLAHILIIAPFLIYIGYKGENTPEFMFWILAGFAVLVFLYHAPKMVQKYRQTGNVWWVPAIHAVYIAPFLGYIAYKRGQVARKYYEFLLLFAFAALGYHAYYLVVSATGSKDST